MLKSGARLIWLTFVWGIPLLAQDARVLPDPPAAAEPAVDTITPVPAPEIPIGGTGLMQMELPKSLKIENQGGTIEGDSETGVRLGGPLKVEGDNGLQIFADSGRIDFKAKSVTLLGDVAVYQGNLMQRGERAVYYYERKFLDASGLRVSVDPILLESGKFTAESRNGRQVYVGENAGVTTHDVSDPDYWIRAKKMTVYPNDKIVFNNLRVYAGSTPVFWLPYLSQPLDGELGYHFVPGARSTWGAYLLNTYGIMLGGDRDPVTGERDNAWLLSRWHVDLRATRGVGMGVDLVDTRNDSDEISGLKLYYLNDLSPDTSRNGAPREPIDNDRYAAELKWRWVPKTRQDSPWRLDANLTLLSDRYFLEDFQPERFNIDPAPDNTLGLYHQTDGTLLSILSRYQVNDFYRSDTRLPEISLDTAKRPLFGGPVLHESKTGIGAIGERADELTASAVVGPLADLTSADMADPDNRRLLDQLSGYERRLAERMVGLPLGDSQRQAIETQLLDPNYGRFHTYQSLSMPMMLGGVLSLTPEAGVGYARYFAVDGPADDSNRTQMHLGTEASMKFSKDLGNYQNHDLGVNGLRHVLQPYGNWSLVSTGDLDAGDPMVDRLTPSTRPRPLDPMRFTAMDEMESWNVFRFGARNRLLTQRDGQTFEWLFLNTYIEAFMDDPEGDRQFSNLYNDVRWQPLPWMGIKLATQFPIASGGSDFSEFSTTMHLMPTDYFQCTLGYRWLEGHPVVVDSNRVALTSYLRLTENWGIGTRHALELVDGTLELQQYTLHRDLGNWVAGVGLTQRNDRLDKSYGLMFSLTLKDFPAASLPFRLDAP